MNQSIKYSLKLCLFVVIFLGIIILLRVWTINEFRWQKVSSYLIADMKRQHIRRGTYKLPDEQKNVAIFGNSKTLAGVIPKKFDSLSNSPTFTLNLGMPALGVSSSYYILKDMIASGQIPDYILINDVSGVKLTSEDVGRLHAMYAVEGAKFLEVIDLFKHTKQARYLLHYFIPLINYKDALRYKLTKSYIQSGLPFSKELEVKILEKSENSFLFNYRYGNTVNINKSFVSEMVKDRGYYFIREQAAEGFESITSIDVREIDRGDIDFVNHNNIDQYAEKSFESLELLQDDPYAQKFFNLTSEHKIPVLILPSPEKLKANDDNIENDILKPIWSEIVHRYSNVTLIVSENPWYVFDGRLFADSVHMTPLGASAYTRLAVQCFNYWIESINEMND